MSKNSSTLNLKRKHSEMVVQTRSRSRSESVENSKTSKISKNSHTSSEEVSSIKRDKYSKNKKEEENYSLSESILSQEDGNSSNVSREQSLKGSNLSKNISSNFANPASNKNFTDSLQDNTIEEENLNESESDEPYYEVEAIVGKKMYRGKPQYHVKWKGYPSDQNTWEPLENLTNVMEMVENFEEMEKLFGTEQGRKKKKTGSAGNDPYTKYLKDSGLQTLIEESSDYHEKKKCQNSNSEKSLINLNSNFTKEKSVNPVQLQENSQSNVDKSSLVPVKVLHARWKDEKFNFLMEWASLPDGSLPKPSLMSHEDIKRDHPYILIDYYERRIRIIKPDEEIRLRPENEKD
jgi:hypothetical protein